jgi:hypothetical protein
MMKASNAFGERISEVPAARFNQDSAVENKTEVWGST